MTRLLVLLRVLGAAGCSRPAKGPTEPAPTPAEIWAAIQPPAARYAIEPAFVFALVAAESDFDPKAQNGDACGLMQIKPAAWRAVAAVPYEPAVWDWRVNLATGIDYLAFCRSTLHAKGVFSYPLLLASFHYGLAYVEERHFDVSRIPIPDNAVYRALWAGDRAPVPHP